MPWIILAVVLALLLGGLIAMLIITCPIAKKVHSQTLVRTSPDKWGHACSAPEHPEQSAMWQEGCRWAEAHGECMQELYTENDGLRLYGQYFDFGAKSCVIILPGRCECHKYSYYFAEPYRAAGMNVLVIDSRCHGFSEGTYCTIGRKESRDLAVWIRLLAEKFAITSVWLHGICVGSGSGLLLMAAEDCPAQIKGITLEGCFTDFRETFKQHMIADHRPLFPVLDLVMLRIYRYTGTNVLKHSPLRCLKKITAPVLFLCGKQDIFSLPKKSRKLYDCCPSARKKLVWFETGSHSHLRIAETEKYDTVIREFVADVQ